jgi:putative endopeptidase
MRFFAFLTVLLTLCTASLGQTSAPSSSAMPDIERFSIDQVDKSLDPCTDFFQYACSKWIKANPIPSDQAGWGTFNSLALWNIAAVHDTLEEAAKPSPNRTPVQQKVGDYYASCMNEDAINKAGIAPLQPELDRIAR